jgi:hypothetical protein
MDVTAAFYFSRGPRSDSGADPIGLKFSALENLPGIGVLRRGDEILGRSSTKRTSATDGGKCNFLPRLNLPMN